MTAHRYAPGFTAQRPPDWTDHGLCREHPNPDLWYPDWASLRQTTAAKRICGDCPVAPQCLAYALDTRNRYGIWGGTTPDERDRILRRRTVRNTPAVETALRDTRTWLAVQGATS